MNGPSAFARITLQQIKEYYSVPFPLNTHAPLPHTLRSKGRRQKPSNSLFKNGIRLPWWSGGKEYTCQFRGHWFHPWSGKIPHAVKQLSPCTTTTEACAPWRPCLLQLEKAQAQKWRTSWSQKNPKHNQWPPTKKKQQNSQTHYNFLLKKKKKGTKGRIQNVAIQ